MAPYLTGEPFSGEGSSPPVSRPHDILSFQENDVLEPIAVVGFSFGFPQDATSSEAFWEMMMQKRNTATEFPNERLNINAVYHPDPNRRGQVSVRGGNFVKEDIAAFDAPFFSISKADAAVMDPQQRALLEYTYKAFENAGLPLEAVSGTKTSVYTGCFTNDWQHLSFKDSEQCETTTALGSQACVLANRISWFYNLTGNSANIDTACSSSLVALDWGCKGLLSGDTEMSVIAGCNLIFAPDMLHSLTNMNMLSPDGRCYSFDHRGNGYGRGEGFGVLILKRLSDALRDGDTIRALVRNTGCNQDGFTPGITQPNNVSQEALIRETYSKAGLSMRPTRYFEAHGTGTPVGDPIEASAIGAAFRRTRSLEDPLIVGAVKSNIGHLEGASGIAGLIKTILVLEKGVIPPNTNFDRTNPKIDTEFLRIKFPLEPMPWPSKGLRRASVNSFGFAGTNAHVILDDVFHYLRDHGLNGHHITVQEPPAQARLEVSKHVQPLIDSNIFENQVSRPRVLVFSANDEKGIKRQSKQYATHHSNMLMVPPNLETYLDDLAYTLDLKRTSLTWKAYAVVQSSEDLRKIDKIISNAQKSVSEPTLGFIFTGQGAQWAGMGRELMAFNVFERSIREADDFLTELGCPWRLREELMKEGKDSRINQPELSQPVCTIIQTALVDLLDSFGVHPTAVVGHSSGEIAAAYCIGAISATSAWKVAYYRGISAAGLAKSQLVQGAMISIGLSHSDVQPFINQVTGQFKSSDLTVACINSPKNVTVSGSVDQIDALKIVLDKDNIFARKLVVNVAYHSPHMKAVAEDYRKMIQLIEKGNTLKRPCTMISSVTGEKALDMDLRSPDYWVANLVSPVRFSDAVSHLFSKSAQRIRKKLDLSHRNHFHINMLIEIGPHAALQGPVRDVLNDLPGTSNIGYVSMLKRKSSALLSSLVALGQVKCLGYPIHLDKVNHPNVLKGVKHRMTLPNLPEYVFDHSNTYWYESRLNNRFRTQPQGKLDLLGKPVTDWNPLEAKWRNVLRVADMPWVEDHVINGTLVYPGAGMLVMAIEAANQMADPLRTVVGFEIKDTHFQRSLNIPQDTAGIEVQLSLLSQDPSNSANSWSAFRLCAYENKEWVGCCQGLIRVEYEAKVSAVDGGRETLEELRKCLQIDSAMADSCKGPIDSSKLYERLNNSGFGFGPAFQPITNGSFGGNNQAKGDIKLFKWPSNEYPQPHVVHPTSLDGLLHLPIAGYAEGGRKPVPTMVPTFLRNVWVRRQGLSYPDDTAVKACTWMTAQDNRGAEFDVSVLDSSKKTVLAQIHGLKLTVIADAKAGDPEDSYQNRQIYYHIEHQPDPDLLIDSNNGSAYNQTVNLEKIQSLERYLNTLSRKSPDRKVLQINCGNGEKTVQMLQGLSKQTNSAEDSIAQYNSYYCTDKHQETIDRARENVHHFKNVSFGILDIENDLTDQGFQEHNFDLILSPVDACIGPIETLTNIRHLLQPEGLFILYDARVEDSGLVLSTTNEFSFEELELLATSRSPSDEQVQKTFRDAGFSDRMMNFTDATNGDRVFVTSITPKSLPNETDKHIILVADELSRMQKHVSEKLMSILISEWSLCVKIASMEEASSMADMDKKVFVVLQELDHPFLYTLSSDGYSGLWKFLIAAKDILWVNSSGGSVSMRPEYALVSGLARTLRNEYEDHRFTTVALEVKDNLSDQQLHILQRILRQNHIYPSKEGGEPEYIEIDGALNIGRVVQNSLLSQEVYVRSLSHQSKKSTIENAPPLRLAIENPGLLDTLHFIEDKDFLEPLADDEVEIQTKAIGMNSEDLLTALGQTSSSAFGLECAGIVTRIGKSSEYVPGDRILMATPGSFKTFSRGKLAASCKVPNGMSFYDAAAIPAQFVTAWEAIHEIARLRKGETILIHEGAGGTGQAAIQIAKYLGGTVFATVGSQSEKELLMGDYGVLEDHIFCSRDTSFAKGIQRVTTGQGVDVVINCLVGESLIASWECIASYGRFIEIGKKDIMSNSSLPMFSFRKNASFAAFDASTWYKDRPVEAKRDLKILVNLFVNKTLHTPRPLHVHNVSAVEEVYRLMQDGFTAGKIVLEVTPEAQVSTVLETKASFNLESNATYVIAGGLGGLGRSIARWMIGRGARNLILLSRSGARTEVQRVFLEELRSTGVRVEAPPCDITNTALTHQVFEKLSKEMPPIKGGIQASMVQRDDLFENMDFDSWQTAVECKTVGSWNLHSVLPSGLDFFILLSSVSGLVGLRGQTNYAAGNTYEDALARYRVAHGEKAISLDLGPMIDDGMLAEAPELLSRVLAYGAFNPVSRQQFSAILDYYCNPDLPIASPQESQVLIGIGTGTSSSSTGLDRIDLSRLPMMRTLLPNANEKAAFGSDDEDNNAVTSRELLAQSESLVDAGNVVVRALVKKLSKSLSTIQGADDVDVYKPLHAYGVDSLLAVELRNWIAKEFQAEVAVFETLGGSTFMSLGMLVAGRSRVRHVAWTV